MSKKKLKGTIKRFSGKNTVAVEVVRVFHHPRYRKRIRTSKVYLAHAEDGQVKIGQPVTIEESRPLSRRKHWVVAELEGKKLMAQSVAISQQPVVKEQKRVSKPKTTRPRRKEKKK